MSFHSRQLEPWGGLSAAISETIVLGSARSLLASAGAGMCCCCCGCCPLLAHLEQGPLRERVSVGRWKAGTRATGICMGSGAKEGRGYESPFLALVLSPLATPRKIVQAGSTESHMEIICPSFRRDL